MERKLDTPHIDRLLSQAIFPETTQIDGKGRLVIGGCDSVELAQSFGTPLYVFDELTLRHQCQRFVAEFGQRYPNSLVIYASKAFLCRALARTFMEEGLGLDVVSGGELAMGRSVGFPMERVYFHGNNKSPEELRLTLDWGVGRVVVDNFHELALLNTLAKEGGTTQDVLLRLSPGIDPHTHHLTTTGITDSKFGFPLATGQAEDAVAQAQASSHLRLVGLHVHLGSPIYETEPYIEAVDTVLDFAAAMKHRHGFILSEFSPGGGFAIQYTRDRPAPSISVYAEAITQRLLERCQGLSLEPPHLVVEPGRAIVGRAGVALYRVGARKDIPGVRNYVAVDGGMGDNIRPALYGASYEALVANKALMEPGEQVTIAGKFCESGDILLKDVLLPPLEPGDLLAVPSSGAYCLAMASNYNAAPKPAIVLVKDGKARLIRRRETLEDLMALDEG